MNALDSYSEDETAEKIILQPFAMGGFVQNPGNTNRMTSIAQPLIPLVKCPYNEIGYKYLKHLKSTDIKWLIEKWGEPHHHSHAKDVNGELWKVANESYNIGREKDDDDFKEEERRLLAEEDRYEKQTSRKQSSSSLLFWLIAILIILIYALYKC